MGEHYADGEGVPVLPALADSPVDLFENRRRLAEDFPNSYVNHMFAMQGFAVDGYLDDPEVKAKFIEQISIPILNIEDHVRKLRREYREYIKREKGVDTASVVADNPDLATGPVRLRQKEEWLRAPAISDAVVAADYLRKAFLALYLQPDAPAEKVRTAAMLFEQSLKHLDSLARPDTEGGSRY